MDPIRFSCENPVKVSVGVLLAMLFGALALFNTPVQLTPDVAEPEITVTTVWPGASAQEVEREIIDEQEEQLKSVEGLQEFKSESRDSSGTITLKFPVGFDLGEARAKVSDKLNQVAEYPEDAREPTITEGAQGNEFIAWVILKPIPPTREELSAFAAVHPELSEPLSRFLDGRTEPDLGILRKMSDQYPALDELLAGSPEPALMRRFAEDFIEARLERIPGVSNANVLGGRDQEFRVVVDPVRLAAHQVTVADLRRALRSQNKNTSAGDIWEGKHREVVRTIGQYNTPEQVADTIIGIRDNAPVRVSDVATVGIDYKKPDGTVRQKGVDGLAINCQQSPGTNVLEIMGPPVAELDLNGDGELTEVELADAKKEFGDCIRIAIEELKLGVLAQRGLTLDQVYDQTEYIYSATDLVTSNIYLGGGLAIFVLLLFLGSPRSVIIIGLSIPISIVASFLFIRGFGRSINVISLAGMAFAVGMVVDNAIVVYENIFRRYQLGESPQVASLKGAQEVWGAVLASTLTTLAVFVPVVFMEGQAGQLFRDIAIAISCAVGLSLIVSVTVIPTAAQRILAQQKEKQDAAQNAAPPRTSLWTMLVGSFANGIRMMISMPGNVVIKLLVCVIFVGVSYFGARVLMPPTEYLPEGNRNLVFAILLPPPGYNLDHMIEIGRDVESELAPYWESERGSPEEAALKGPRMENFFFVARGGNLFMGCKAEDPLRAGELVPVLRQAAGRIPGIIPIVTQSSLFSGGLSGGRAVDVEITGPDIEQLNVIGADVFMRAAGIGPYAESGVFPADQGHQARPMQNLESTNPELHVRPRWEQAADLGMSADDLGYTVNALVDGAYAGDYQHQGREIDLVIYGADQFASREQDLENLPVSSPGGKLINLGAVANVVPTGGPERLNHIERQRSVTVQIKPAPTMALESAILKVDQEIRRPVLESPLCRSGQYQIRLAGTSDKLADTRRAMSGNLILAALITYLLMAALFESYLYPLVIMTSVLLALVGGFGGLAVLNLFIPQTLDVLTMLGFVILIGTVVNNAILIVHQALSNMREEGMGETDAIVDSVRTRVRPILMSTMTTVLGMLPLVVPLPSWEGGHIVWAPGAGSELYRGLGSVVLGGLIISTIFTLILIPAGFSLMLDAEGFVRRLFGLVPNSKGDEGELVSLPE
ncbi:MAG: efflux RND transporter permease subunit [Planctomycetaceae bacterium]|nr:efflux RND transporter permease subunit [Planctomycetaceae bacterium]